MKKRVVLFDYGGVLARHHCDPAEQMLCSVLTCTREQLRAELSEKSRLGSDFRRGGVTETAFWTGISKRLNVPSRLQAPAKYLTRLWAHTYEPWPEVLDILSELRRRKTAIGIVTNVDAAREPYIKRALGPFVKVDMIFSSHRLGVTKYDASFWRKVKSQLRSELGDAANVTYVDDRESHVASARAVGWAAHRFATPSRLRAALGL